MTDKWKKKTLGELTVNFDGQRIPVKESERKPGHFPYYGASGIVDYVDKYIFDGEYLLVAEDGENLRTQKTPVAFLARGKFWVNNHAHIITGNAQSDTRFLMYALNNADINGYLTGSTMPKLTQGNLNRIPILAPPPDEQRAIAAVLGALDDKIELNRRMNATLEALAQALFKSRFVDAAAELLKSWRAGKLRDCCERVENGGTPKRDEPSYWSPATIPWLTSGEVRQAIVIRTENSISEEGLKNSSAKLWPAGTTVVALYGATAGQVCFLGDTMCSNQACCGLIPKRDMRYYVYLRASSSVVAFEQQTRGSAQQNLSQQIVADFPAVIPDDATLDKFDQIVHPLFSRWIANLNESRTLAELRDALLPKLLSGELRVPAKLREPNYA